MKNDLSQIELLILQKILEEKSSNAIAEEFEISLKEVDRIRHSIYKKMEVKNAIGLVKKSIENNLFTKKP